MSQSATFLNVALIWTDKTLVGVLTVTGIASKILITFASLLVTYFSLFKTVMVVSYARTEGCGQQVRDLSDSVLVDSSGQASTITGYLVSADDQVSVEAKPMKIKDVECLNHSKCEVWEKPGVNSSMVTLLVSGPSYDAMYFKPFVTGTPLDEAQKYFQHRGQEGIVVALNEAAPRCLNLKIMDISYDHLLRWDWPH
jgi:hypothetical protein